MALFYRSILEGSRQASICWWVGGWGRNLCSSPLLPPQQWVGMVMDEAGEKADWFLDLVDKVSYVSWGYQTEEMQPLPKAVGFLPGAIALPGGLTSGSLVYCSMERSNLSATVHSRMFWLWSRGCTPCWDLNGGQPSRRETPCVTWPNPAQGNACSDSCSPHFPSVWLSGPPNWGLLSLLDVVPYSSPRAPSFCHTAPTCSHPPKKNNCRVTTTMDFGIRCGLQPELAHLLAVWLLASHKLP